MTDSMIVILGVIAAIVLLLGVGVTAYSRIKSFGRHGARLDELLSNLEDELEATHVSEQLSSKRKGKGKDKSKDENAAPSKQTDDNDDTIE